MQSEPIARRQFDTNPKCDICGKQRSIRVHSKCSKIRQQKHVHGDTLDKITKESP